MRYMGPFRLIGPDADTMLQIANLTYRIEGRTLFDGASAVIPDGHKVGLVGRNGSGKTTLLALISGELVADEGTIELARDARIGRVAQEAPGDQRPLIDFVLGADAERARLVTEAESAGDPHRIAEIQLRLTDIGAHDAPARAASVLAGLGFDESAQQRPLSSFSGGWRMRVALAALLFRAPDLLLLDEPTNYLDLEGAMWLEGYLRRYRHTVIIVSHDRDLLAGAVGSIIHLDQARLITYSGGYDEFERQRRERQALQLRLKKRQEAARRHMEAFVARFRAKATKARQAQSRLKALARMEAIPDLVEDRIRPFRFASPEKPLPAPLVRLEDVSAGYAAGAPVLTDITLRLDPDDRIGLLGANGNGKSTLARLLAGRLAPLSGTLRADRRMIAGYFAQHQLDELSADRSPFQHLRPLLAGARDSEVRARLGFAGFSAGAADTPAGSLSGGEKARLLLALATVARPHLLILDEPTNHLDIDSREALALALADYEGAVILISHDRHLTQTVADRLWLVEDGTVRAYDGDLDDYRARVSERARSPQQGKGSGEGGDAAQRRRRAAAERARIAPLKRAVEGAEKRIERLRRDIARVDGRLAEGALYRSGPDAAARLARERAHAARALAEAEEEWLEAAESYEAARRAAGDDGNRGDAAP
jgi:ATP-binding cassette subfamily F protein 3